ncbi:DUF3658 domain-containing protein [Hyphomonas sp.]|uniref:DUF3658 domain-containing protein n=1 Tax=Hyphomonas sp. TaxID=87 RepID=UPI00391AFF7A
MNRLRRVSEEDKHTLAPALHICGGHSAAGAVRQALQAITSNPEAPILISDMIENAGPLDLLDMPDERLDWFGGIGMPLAAYLGMEGDGQVLETWKSFWARIDGWTGPVVIWTSRRNAANWSLRLVLARRIDTARPVHVVDVGRPDVAGTVWSDIGDLRPDTLILHAAHMETGSLGLHHHYERLIAGGGALRIVADGKISPAGLEGLDARILSGLTQDWTRLVRHAAAIPGAFSAGGYRDLPYPWLLWRLSELERLGRIERRGGGFDPAFRENPLGGEVRLTGS